MENRNWDIVKQAFIDGDILEIPLILEGQKVLLIGHIHQIDMDTSQILFDTGRFIQKSMPPQWEGITLYDISISTLEDEIRTIEDSTELIVRSNQTL